MNYAIIAAGEGSRLVKEGINLTKPMVKIKGEPMIKRLLDIFAYNHATNVSIIINSSIVNVKEYVESLNYKSNIQFKVKSTQSSMHSLYELKEIIGNESFCLTTVDTIFKPQEFQSFITYAQTHTEKDAIMAVTSFVDDEKPLYIRTYGDKIIEFSDEKKDYHYVSGGIYFLRPQIWKILDQSIARGNQHLRNFQRDLLSSNFNIGYYEFSKIIDVDHIKDIKEAENFIQ